MTTPQDRRFEPRSTINTRGVVIAPGLELTCLIVDHSATGLRLRLDRNIALPDQVQVIDIGRGLAIEADVVWRKGQEAGLKQRDQSSLRGLVPSRLAAARDAFLRASGR
ncbi:MAG: PilZ domain-containing protein [Brevundimonas sp.]|uniref:PilZ domain-containing protein n=1 Tax=Brevundimonas sp. TaxID=1871086 RepID=UPI002736B6DD|nr:PilZ domain-containing protein [Brevundimonas sp.]MDP3656396.1 PilZ domain-containing protein [Brevundimonas sp.]MDZ4110884.1 PilZ domain-containing protein [Brevundimonas sp.]